MFAEAAKQAGSTQLEDMVRVLRSTTFPTVVGQIAFDAKGDVKDPKYSVYRYQDGKYGEI